MICATCGCHVRVSDDRDWEEGDSCWDCTISNQKKEIERLERDLAAARELGIEGV